MQVMIWILFSLLITNSVEIDENTDATEDRKECEIVDCTNDQAVELCPKTCSAKNRLSQESEICKFADCAKPNSLQLCPRTCAASTRDASNSKDKDGKTTETEKKDDNPAPMATPNGRENIYLQISDITVPTYGYREIDFSGEAKCVPNKARNVINVYGAMTGYDAIIGNPMNSLVDPGIKARIFLHDCKFGYFDFVSDVRNDLQCDSDFSMKTIESMDQYEQERKGSNTFSAGASISAKGGFGAIKGSASASYTRSSNSDQMASEKVLEKYKGEITRAKATCLTHSVTIADEVRPVFTPDFIHHLEEMDVATRSSDDKLKKEAISKFVKEFGTHYSKDTRMGAELIYERRFESKGKSIQEKKERNECVRDEAAVSVGASTPNVEVSAKGHYDNKDCEGMKSGSDFSNNEGFEAVKTISRGSRPTDIKRWIDETFTPIAIKRRLDDISNLFQDKWMTKSVFYGFDRNLAGNDIQKMYNKYIEQYCSLILYGILDENCNVIACTDSNYICYNGGTCTNFEGSPRCDCPADTYGKFCEVAWLEIAEEKSCKDTKGVTIVPNKPFTNILDCAFACKAKLQNKMFAFENKDGCKKGETGCQCHCIESITNDCTLSDESGFTLYKFRTETAGEYFLADTQAECSDIESQSIVSVDSADGCQKAVKSLGVENKDVIIEDHSSVPKGCYVYTPSNKLYFNQHSTGLDKVQWKYDTRLVCRDFQISMETAGGCGEIEVTSDLEIQKCRTGTYKIQQQVLNQKPVFKHETKEEYLFYMKKGEGFWMFGSEVGVDNGGIMNGICNDGGENNINVPVESLCPSRWFYWKKSMASWVIDSSMSVRCPDSSKEDATKERAILPSPEAECEPTDSDKCLTITPNWDENRDCAFAKSYCDSWAKDARRCCPQTCGTGLLTESQCKALDSKGTCTYPAENQCPNGDHSPEDVCQASPGDLCLSLPCGVNANCDSSSGDVKCSCPENMVGDPKLKCEVFDPNNKCVITSALECGKEAKKLGLELGTEDYAFEGDYNQKGCFYYSPTSSEYKNVAFFGTTDSLKKIVEKTRSMEKEFNSEGRKSLTKQCLVADYDLISKGQKCSTVDSDDYIIFPKGCFGCVIDDYLQICKSMSNKFSVDENGKGYCHVGTRQTGRCEIQDDPKMTLYEIRYKGYALASEGFRCEDIGMKATEELESCKAAMSTIQKIIPDIGKWDDIVKDTGSFHNQPKGCSVADNKIYLNTGDTDSLSAGSRQVCSGPRCNGYPTTDWNCCNPINQCGKGEGDCDTDDDCVGDLICGSSRDSSNNCKTEFIYSRSFWTKSADCCTEPECTTNADCNTLTDPDKKICLAGRCIRCRGAKGCCTRGEKCHEGEGSCYYDDECMPGLMCGADNCRVKVSPWDSADAPDCCYKPATCPVITVQKVTEEGEYFKATKNELRALYDFDNWDGYTMEIIQEGDCGFEWVKGTDKEQQWDGCYTGEIKAWKKDAIGRRNCEKCSTEDVAKSGQWSAGDTIKSKACSFDDPCFNGEQDRYETGIDCGGDCKRKCSSESEREIPWLLSTALTN